MRGVTRCSGVLVFSLMLLGFTGISHATETNKCDVEELFFSYFLPDGQTTLVKPNYGEYRIALAAEPRQEKQIKELFSYFSKLSHSRFIFTRKDPNIIIFFSENPRETAESLYQTLFRRFFANKQLFTKYGEQLIESNIKYYVVSRRNDTKEKLITTLILSKADFADRKYNGINQILLSAIFGNIVTTSDGSNSKETQQLYDIFDTSPDLMQLSKCDSLVAQVFLSSDIEFGMDRQTISEIIGRATSNR